MERSRSTITAEGLGLATISYDSVDILREFAERRGITFPMLSDSHSVIIRQFGLLNEQVAPGSRHDGVPHPGIFLVNASGVVLERVFEASALNLAWTDEALTGYKGRVPVAIDVSLGTRQEIAAVRDAGHGLAIGGTVRLQACDDRICWAPEAIPVTWHVDLRAPDLERSPESLQHRPKA